jgi:hypothetical protein
MGGNGSQKLLPWRGANFPSGAGREAESDVTKVSEL